jgi:hypothetical protein
LSDSFRVSGAGLRRRPSASPRRWNLRRAFRDDEREQALVILVARRAALQVRAHTRDRPLDVCSGQLELYEFVEPREALLARQLRAGRAQ